MTTLTDNSDQANLNTPGLGPDTIFAGAGADFITTSTLGGSLIFGEGDNDTLISVGPNDTLYGGNDEDSLVGQRERVFMLGDAGNDTVIAQARNSTLLGGAGDDLLQGTVDGNLMFGGQGSDTMLGGALGRDTLYGGKDNDSLGFFIAGGGNNLGLGIGGSAGGNQGNNFLRGDLGDDLVVGINQRDTLFGGRGNDTLRGVASNSYLSGDLDNDTLVINNSTQSSPFAPGSVITIGIEKTTLLGGAGNDSLVGGIGEFGAGKNLFDGGDGNDTIRVFATQDTALGGAGDDFITSQGTTAAQPNITLSGGAQSSFGGFAGRNLLDGGDGNDTIVAAFVSDTMIGGAGNDSLSGIFNQAFGGDGNDTIDATFTVVGTTPVLVTLDGGLGDDSLIGNRSATNFMNGGEGSDTIIFGSTGDKLVGSFGGNDFISYASTVNFASPNVTTVNFITDNLGNNFITGGNGTDVITTGAGNDTLYGGSNSLPFTPRLDGNDTLNSGGGNDMLLGGYGDDYLIGGDGNDSLGGGPGSDTLIGGSGDDSFYYSNFQEGRFDTLTGGAIPAGFSTSPDQIGDFNQQGQDKIVLDSIAFGFGQVGGPSQLPGQSFQVFDSGTYVGNSDTTNIPAAQLPQTTGFLFYQAVDGRLGYDPDGASGSQVPITLAILNNKPALGRSDIILI